MSTCKHFNCSEIRKRNHNGGAGIFPVVDYHKGRVRVGHAVMVVFERDGPNANKYNVAGGKLDNDRCWIRGAERECMEELKFELDWDYARDPKTGHIRWFAGGSGRKTPIFVLNMPAKTSRGPINKLIQKANADPTLPFCEREVDHVTWARLKNGVVVDVDGTPLPCTSYLESALRTFFSHIAEFNL